MGRDADPFEDLIKRSERIGVLAPLLLEFIDHLRELTGKAETTFTAWHIWISQRKDLPPVSRLHRVWKQYNKDWLGATRSVLGVLRADPANGLLR